METLNTPDSALPSTTRFIENLISQLSERTANSENEVNTESQRPFSALPAGHASDMKQLMLTLHCLFPNEFLPALDILDRGLVRRFVKEDYSILGPDASEPLSPGELTLNGGRPPLEDLFFVISMSTAPNPPPGESLPTSLRPNADQKGYEVRLQAWNCTCPTFTFAAFRDLGPDLTGDDSFSGDLSQSHLVAGVHYYTFGGSLTRRSVKWSHPVCKHLLACVLAVRCPALNGPSVNDHSGIVVSAQELAGWCAGWGG
ncbi:hypothetical protein BDV32DRAFT_161177 [Aspergillus pseudonomiae]|uniref:Uncharacterized protein n=1 Tax=Aspergillus pseudonomiae TaxID=1506151 RepID=A0A5N6HPE1_9EURO|nr:uncharacterized protein BDV37DRAFT_245247 [Aspergillus pseudonomiae]KAB8256372.1 hypothetical protein BDV32DRAFT_161177 [Aspergillus pseudonomiae]KAE8405240.1 hypothetical protein BDV37DRAFT_245247 [Aspergillus pseudonomiae]